jgi:hypothetical protein
LAHSTLWSERQYVETDAAEILIAALLVDALGLRLTAPLDATVEAHRAGSQRWEPEQAGGAAMRTRDLLSACVRVNSILCRHRLECRENPLGHGLERRGHSMHNDFGVGGRFISFVKARQTG